MKPEYLDIILREIDTLRTKYTNCKAYFPHITENLIGHENIDTAPFYLNKGFYLTFSFSEPLTIEHIHKNNEITTWINENVIIRLCAMLESYNMFSPEINHSIDGSKELDLIRRLRNVFAHSSSKYNPNDKDKRRLVEELISHFKLDIDNPQEFPLNIDTVIYPLFDGCKRYVQGKYAKTKK